MSVSLPNNKQEKRARYKMLVKQGSITQQEANQMYREYLRLFKRVNGNMRLFNNITIVNMLKLVSLMFAALC